MLHSVRAEDKLYNFTNMSNVVQMTIFRIGDHLVENENVNIRRAILEKHKSQDIGRLLFLDKIFRSATFLKLRGQLSKINNVVS